MILDPSMAHLPRAEVPPAGVLVVDKPSGPTSHDVVDRVRRAVGIRRIGHTGTLDPFATGVLAVCVGKATRLVRFLSEGDKVYDAVIRLGYATTTDDVTGEPLAPAVGVGVAREQVEGVCRQFVGEQLQIPPMFSAKRHHGERLYKLARRGRDVAREACRVFIHEIVVADLRSDRLKLTVRCAGGTYIRALARDIGAALGVGGHLEELRRTRTGGFELRDAVRWDDIPEASERLIPLRGLLPGLPAVRVGPEGRAAWAHGKALGSGLVVEGFPVHPPQRIRVLDEAGNLLGLAMPRGFSDAGELSMEGKLQPEVVLIGAGEG
jgi:tRNA pseudouridine55 synthase